MSARLPSAPPLLDGYSYLEPLGSGGFADVFKYQQLRPRREVAIKVLLRGLGAHAQQQFEHEANLMALLSNHPSIVSIYASGVAPDGRPYLVMENCQQRHLGARIKAKPLSVGRALTVTIQIAGAVETAHRLGILHRDIKPANILFTEFGRPALTDFGISVVEGGSSAVAFSVAWAPPEQIENRPMGPSGDVYSLAATLWAMLVGRSPFDVSGDNSSLAVSQRVKTMPPPPTGRAGVPESLERILRTALAKRPEQRYATALEFARALQAVQAELHESVTTIEVRDERGEDEIADETESGTRVTGFALIDPDAGPTTSHGSFEVSDSRGTRVTGVTAASPFTGPTTTGGSRWAPAAQPVPVPAVQPAEPAPAAPVLQHGRGSLPSAGPLEFTGPNVPQVPDPDTQVAPVRPDAVPEEPTVRAPISPWPIAIGAVAVLVVGALIAAWVINGSGAVTTATTSTTSTPPAKDPVGVQVLPPTDVKGKVSGDKVIFTWENPDPQDGDRYNYTLVRVDVSDPQLKETAKMTATVAKQAGPTCIDVSIVRSNRQYSRPTRGCAS